MNTEQMIPIESISKQDLQNPLSLASLCQRAKDYLAEQDWCICTKRGFLALCIEDIVAVFYFEVEPRDEDVDSTHWVIMGDMPPAYLYVPDNPTPELALEGYIWEMRLWISAVDNNESLEGIIPVNAPPTKEFADMLRWRLDSLEGEITGANDAEDFFEDNPDYL